MSSQGSNCWGKLINTDKSPAPFLEQLCLGIAKLLSTFDSSFGTTDLTPDRLAAFYRKVGGNYDALFLETRGPALSFIYQSLGCFHSLQPTTNAFEAPSIPALLPNGFVRWQTIQLLLDPDKHSQYLQNAVSQWDIADVSGRVLPKVIPRDAFPSEPDAGMVQWHEEVSRRLEHEYIKSCTPHYTPLSSGANYYRSTSKDPRVNAEDYFSHHHHHHHGHGRPWSRRPSDMDSAGDAARRSRHRSHRSADYDYLSASRGDRMRSGLASSRGPSLSPRQASPSRSRARRLSLGTESVSQESDTSSEDSGRIPPQHTQRPVFSDIHHDRRRDSSPRHRNSKRSHSHDAVSTRKPKRDVFPDHPQRYHSGDTTYTTRRASWQKSDTSSSRSSGSTTYTDGNTHPKTRRPSAARVREYIIESPPPTRPRFYSRYTSGKDDDHVRDRGHSPSPEEKRGSHHQDRSRSFKDNLANPDYPRTEKRPPPVRSNAAMMYIPVSVAGESEYGRYARRPVVYER